MEIVKNDGEILNKEGKAEISVVCCAYNQAEYIEKTLDSLLGQRVEVPFEIVVHDDCSTDGTREIIEHYEKQYPELIKPVYEEENQYSKGYDVFSKYGVPKCSGRYIAICEGDDFWTDEEKLQKQYDTLEKHPEADMCACRASVISGEDEQELWEIRPGKEDRILTAEEVILGGGRYLATASLFFRKSMWDVPLEAEKIICFDYTMQIRGALRGGICYLDDKMVAYRNDAAGSWSVNVERNMEKRRLHLERETAFLRKLDEETQGKYHAVITERLKAYTPFVEQLKANGEAIQKELSDAGSALYLWGMGMRGEAFLDFCVQWGIALSGVCDKKNDHVGEYAKGGYRIFHTKEVLDNSACIVVSNDMIEEDLKQQNYRGKIINLQKYIPLS